MRKLPQPFARLYACLEFDPQLFVNTNNYLRDEDFHRDETAENIKMTELIYLIASHEDCCLKSKLLSNVDAAKENFEQIVYDHIFKDISIEELSKLTNRSLTSFKKEFRRHFMMPPHNGTSASA